MKKSWFKKALLIYSLALFVSGTIFILYIWNTLITYEKADINNFITDKITTLSTTDIKKYLPTTKNKLDLKSTNIKRSYEKYFQDKKITLKKQNIAGQKLKYDVYANEVKIYTVSLKEVKKVQKLKILNYIIYDVTDIKSYFDRGLYYYDIKIPDTYDLYVNDHKVSKDYLIETANDENLNDLYAYVSLPKTNLYTINHLNSKPKIVIKKGNQKIAYEVQNNTITAKNLYKNYATWDDVDSKLKAEIDPMQYAKDWSLFLTNDLAGGYRGFDAITEYFIKDSTMYQRAYKWAHNIDITFVSSHYFKPDKFTNEKITNITFYSDEAFSCNIYLDKNMVVRGEDKTDSLKDKVYFIKYDKNNDGVKEWLVIATQAIIESDKTNE